MDVAGKIFSLIFGSFPLPVSQLMNNKAHQQIVLETGGGEKKKKRIGTTIKHTHPAIQILIMDMQTEEQPQTDCSGANTLSQHKKKSAFPIKSK